MLLRTGKNVNCFAVGSSKEGIIMPAKAGYGSMPSRWGQRRRERNRFSQSRKDAENAELYFMGFYSYLKTF